MRLLPQAAIAALGPLVALVAPPKPPQEIVPTYTGQIAPLFRARCVACHRTGGSAPFSLSTYGQAKQWSAMSLKLADSRQMPPWKPSENGVFHDENKLSAEELRTLRAWDKAGSPQGTPNLAVPEVAVEASVATSDKILQAAKPYVVSAGAEDEYRYFVVKNPYAETKWLSGIDLKPSNCRIVHHMTAFLDTSREAERLSIGNRDGQVGYSSKHGGRFRPTAVLGFWAPGMRNRSMPEGTAMELPPNAQIVVQVHYVSTGRAEADRWSLGLKLTDAPKRTLYTHLIEKFQLDIPAGAANYQAVEEQTVGADTTLWALMPHAHALAKKMCAEAILPDGTRRALISISDWDPAWQSMYWFKESVHLPKGTRVRFTVTYDNSEANVRNPYQPPRLARYGEGSRDEMMLLAMLMTRD